MKSHWKNATRQSNHPNGARIGGNWWIVAVVAILGLPAPAWAQFKEPVLTDIRSGTGSDWSATFSSDMLEVYWIGDPVDTHGDFDIWTAHRASTDAQWENVEPLEIVDSHRVEMNPHLSYDGLTLTFVSDGRAGGFGGFDLWQTTRESRFAPWQEPVNMGPTINTRGNEGAVTISEDGLELIFTSGCTTPRDCVSQLHRSTRESLDDEWSTPELMTPAGRGDQLGSVGNPSLSIDGLALYYQVGVGNASDVFVSRRSTLDSFFGPGENLGETINTRRRETAARIAADGSLYYTRNYNSGHHGLRIWRAEPETPLNLIFLNAGDADQDLDFDQLDLVQVQVAAKYLTGQAATWGEGDWDGAPGGEIGNPPSGDGLFNQFDIIAANVAGVYLQGPYAVLQSGGTQGDDQTSLVYDATTRELAVDSPTGHELTSINVTSASGQFIGAKPAVLDGAFDNFAADNVFKATFGGSFGSISFGSVLPVGIPESELVADLSAVGSLAGGGDLGEVDLVYIPEPTAGVLLLFGWLSLSLLRRHR